VVDEVQVEARALGDPTRHRIFRYIVDAERPVGVGELTDFVKLNHNAVRQHLAVLKDAGLVLEEVESRDQPGRPRLLYRLHPEAAGSWGTSGPYVWLAGLLSGAVSRGIDARQVGREEGQRRATEIAGSGDSARLLEEEMARRGFRPTRSEQGRRIDLVVGRCPFAEVASEDPEVVCQLHLGLAEGLAEGLGGVRVDRLVIRNPRRAGCRLIVRRSEQSKALA
jgi:predicted ArsR family transcriptional regulator